MSNTNADTEADIVNSKTEPVGEQYEIEDGATQTESFEEMNLRKEIMHGIYSYGFEKPSRIQQHAIMPITSGRDVVAQSQSGTGKTGAFAIGVLQRIEEANENLQALILSPTRDLSKQIYQVITSLGKYTGINIVEVIGGYRNTANYNNAQVIVGTPGRVLDDLSRGKLSYKGIKMFVLDEADEMLSKGFLDQIKKIFMYVPKQAQIVLISATMPPEILELTNLFMNKPIKILVKTEELTLEGMKQFYVDLDNDRNKFDALCDLYGSFAISQSIIFCNTKRRVIQLANDMARNNFTVAFIHGDIPQVERNKTLDNFRAGIDRVLITTDVLSRGLDIQSLSLVINYDLCQDSEVYIHRIGRTSRYGKKGVAITFITAQDHEQLKTIERFYSTHIGELPANVAEILKM